MATARHTAIDLNEGVITSRHRTLDMYIHMYVKTPGVYLDDHGNEVPEELAEEVGFDVKKYKKARLKAEALTEFHKEMEEKLAYLGEEDDIMAQEAGYKVVAVSEDAANVVDENNNVLNTNVLPKAAAMLLFNKLTAGKKQSKINETLTKKAEAAVETAKG